MEAARTHTEIIEGSRAERKETQREGQRLSLALQRLWRNNGENRKVENMNQTSLECTINDTAELRNLILENPELPVLIYCGEESWSGEYSYELAEVNGVEIKELTLYNDYWLERNDYIEELSNDLSDEEEYEELSNEEFEQMVQEKAAGTEFVKAIVIYVG